MGWTVVGVKPTKNFGESFTNSNSHWNALWDYIVTLGINGEHIAGLVRVAENAAAEGALGGLPADDCETLSELLQHDIESGGASRCEAGGVLCSLCKGSGTLDRSDHVYARSKEEKCFACDGKGRLFDFSEENVKEFIEFLKNCNGFLL